MRLMSLVQSALPMVAMTLMGIASLAQIAFAAGPGSRQVAVFVPPWATAGITQAAAFGLPIVDLRWDGHLIILDLSQDQMAVKRLRNMGYLLFDSNLRAGCVGTTEKVPPNET